MASCEKDEILKPIKTTRLKTYTNSDYKGKKTYNVFYNNFNKIDSVVVFSNGSYSYKSFCIYKADHTLDSIGYMRGPYGISEIFDVEANKSQLVSAETVYFGYTRIFIPITNLLHY